MRPWTINSTYCNFARRPSSPSPPPQCHQSKLFFYVHGVDFEAVGEPLVLIFVHYPRDARFDFHNDSDIAFPSITQRPIPRPASITSLSWLSTLGPSRSPGRPLRPGSNLALPYSGDELVVLPREGHALRRAESGEATKRTVPRFVTPASNKRIPYPPMAGFSSIATSAAQGVPTVLASFRFACRATSLGFPTRALIGESSEELVDIFSYFVLQMTLRPPEEFQGCSELGTRGLRYQRCS